MIIDYADCATAAECALNDLVERDYTLRIILNDGSKFDFQPDFIENDVITGCKLNTDFEKLGDAIEIPLSEIKEVVC